MEVTRGGEGRARRSARLGATGALVMLAVLASGRGADAAPSRADVEAARRHYARGVELYKQGVDAGALAELQRAYELAPNGTILYNIGLVELQLRDLAGALDAFERYLAEPGPVTAEATAARRREVEAHVVELRREVATLSIRADVDGAEITVDDASVGRAPLASGVRVNPGRHRVGASAEGREPVSKIVSVVGGDDVAIALELRATPDAAPPAASAAVEAPPVTPPRVVSVAPPAAPPPEGGRDALWIGWAVTGALAAGALVTGLDALGTDRELSNAKSDGPRSGTDLDALAGRARALAAVSDVLGGAAVVAGGVTLFLTLRPRARALPASGARDAQVAIGPGSISLRGAF